MWRHARRERAKDVKNGVLTPLGMEAFNAEIWTEAPACSHQCALSSCDLPAPGRLCQAPGNHLQLAEHLTGSPCSKEIDVSRLEACNPCSGSGIKSGTSASTCGTCGGSGQVVQAVRTPLGVFQQARPQRSSPLTSARIQTGPLTSGH